MFRISVSLSVGVFLRGKERGREGKRGKGDRGEERGRVCVWGVVFEGVMKVEF